MAVSDDYVTSRMPYSLRSPDWEGNYYSNVSRYTDLVMEHAKQLLGHWASDYQSSAQSHQDEICHEECLLELLTLGTLWRLYGSDAGNLPKTPQRVLETLANWRSRGGSAKTSVDLLRGLLATLFLAPDDDHTASQFTPSSEHLLQLLDYLAATGDFRQEVRRLRPWASFISNLSSDKVNSCLAEAIVLASWFEESSLAALGRYTEGVERFLEQGHPSHRWNEDIVATGRQRVEYHLNMVGAEIMSRAYRSAFLAAPTKLVVLPACTRIRSDDHCPAAEASSQVPCLGCSPACQVNRIVQLGKIYGFKVVVAAHESDVFKESSDNPLRGGSVGVVGVACVTNLLAGGWKAKTMGIPVQCVVLDHCGCQHWSDERIPTCIDEAHLVQIFTAI